MTARDLIRAIRRHWPLAGGVFAVALAGGLLLVPGAPARFRSEAAVVLRESPFPAAPDFPLAPASPPAEAFRSDTVLERAVREDSGQTGSAGFVKARIDDLRGRLAVVSAPGVLRVACTAASPRRAAALANAVARAFEKESHDARRSEIERSIREVDRALGERARAEAEAAATLLASGAAGSEARLAALVQAQAADRAEREALAARIEDLAGRIERGDPGPARHVQTAESDRLAAELDRALRELEDLRQAHSAGSPPILRLERRVEELRRKGTDAQAREALEARFAPVRALLDEARALGARREALARESERRDAEIRALGAAGTAGPDAARRRELEARVRALAESRGGLETLRARLAREKDLAGGLVERIDEARGASVESAPFGWILGVSAFLALAAARLRERLAPTIRTEYDVRRFVNLPLLGILPRAPRGASAAPASDDPRAPLAEGLEALAALFERGASQSAAKVWALTSAGPGEGKSTVACGLAAALARAGRQVLLVDADLRRASLHKLLGVETGTGLSTYVSGASETAESVLAATPVPNLTLLPSGPLIDSPAPYLRSERFRALLAGFRDAYDFVIMDLPPVGAAADALLAAPLADGTLLVLSAARTRKEEITSAKRALRGAGARLAGCVLNMATLDSRGYYYYSAATVETDA